MRITNTGNVGIGTTVPDSIKLDVEDDIEIGTGTTGCVRDADNTTLVGTCVSDLALKKNIVPLPEGTLDKLAQLRPVTFEWRNDEFGWLNGQQGVNYGLIAQEVEQVFPEMVHTDDRGYKRVSYDIGLSMRMLEGIRELDARTSFIANAATSTALFVDVAGNVGIGTSTPQHRLAVSGDVAAEAFVNISTRELKTDITGLATTTEDGILEQLATTNVYSYRYKDEPSSNPLRVGLIVDSAPTEVLSVNQDGVDIYKLAVFTLAGVKAQERKISAIDERVGVLEQAIAELKAAASAAADAASLAAGSATDAIASAANSATSLAADGASAVGLSLAAFLDGLKLLGVDIAQNLAHFVKVVADNFQVGSALHPTGITMYDKTTGEPYCFQIDNGSATTTAGACTDIIIPVASQTASAAGAGGDTSQGGVTSGASASGDQPSAGLAPTISINGNNPATISVGDTFGDLGAIITGPTEADKNLGIHTYLDGVAMDTINLDTSTAGEHTIDYVATNSFGTATSTRTVIVEAPAGQVVTDTTSTPPNTVATSTDVVASSATTTPTTP